MLQNQEVTNHHETTTYCAKYLVHACKGSSCDKYIHSITDIYVAYIAMGKEEEDKEGGGGGWSERDNSQKILTLMAGWIASRPLTMIAPDAPPCIRPMQCQYS